MRPTQFFVGPRYRYRLLPHVAWFTFSVFCGAVGPIATDDTSMMVSLSVCLCAWLLCLFVFFYQKSARFYPYVSEHVSRSAMRPIATVSHIAWSVYLCIFCNAWWRGVVVASLVWINEVNLRWARLVLVWVTVRVRLPGRHFISVCNQPSRSTQPSTLRGTVKWVPAKGRWCSAAGE